MRAVRAINLIALLLRAGDVHPNPGPSLHVAQFNVLGFSPEKKISLLHKAKMLALDVVLLQELHVTEDEASRLAIPGFHCFAVARDAKGGGVAVLVRDALQCSLTSQSVSEVVEHTTVCVKVGDELSYFTSAYFPRGHKVSAAALSRLSQDDRRTHIIGADTNCHHEDWDRYVAPNPALMAKCKFDVHSHEKSYAYLLDQRISVLTRANLVNMQKRLEANANAIATLKQLSEKDLWLKDLAALKTELGRDGQAKTTSRERKVKEINALALSQPALDYVRKAILAHGNRK
ncbi:hypothetical protein XU18_3873 [Perkinsela sp. CCAP 1560/4]|nr:hypothetical protein XU18_3873 [Perkinsela sp. CCAP 1560/4]|eukprot:KNH04999.1 hypothetical protein XU18_3873 [Perkinsela sp. CCAP 1560/4]